MAYDAPEAASEDLAGRAEQNAPAAPSDPAVPPTLEQVQGASTPAAAPDHGAPGAASGVTTPTTGDAGAVPGLEADSVQLDGPNLPDEDGTGLTGGPIGN